MFLGGPAYQDKDHKLKLNEEALWFEAGLKLDGLVYGDIVLEGEGDSKKIKNSFLEKLRDWFRSGKGFVCSKSIYVEWLRKHGSFDSQIYGQLAKVMRQNGQDDEAVRICIAREDHRRENDKFYKKLWGFILKWSIGYSYKTYRALIWSALIIVLGGFIFSRGYAAGAIIPTDPEAFKCYYAYRQQTDRIELCKDKEVPPYYPNFNPWVYSLETFFPINSQFGQKEKWRVEDHGDPGRMYHVLLWVLTISGWLFTTLGIAGFTGLIRKD